MLQDSVKQFWEEYRVSAKKHQLRLGYLQNLCRSLNAETGSIRESCDFLILLKARWQNSAEMYDEVMAVRELNLQLLLHIQRHAHSMSPDLLARLMKTWTALNDYFKALNMMRALIEQNQDITTVLDLISQHRNIEKKT